MKCGIKAKDIRDFEKCVSKLNAIMDRIREYKPDAHIYATPDELSLMTGFSKSIEVQNKMLATTVSCPKLEAGDW